MVNNNELQNCYLTGPKLLLEQLSEQSQRKLFKEHYQQS